ncbi:ubiquinone/menaquinone biosynthesis C-methylase UbiE [Actinoalloteichus hoggarensis]|uniref:Ubiquinone/menaquinone biosynthesis methyltransferase n=1 Tax=Actinoalloteichus hoggarensis TaxID=1470176 RepID=A0A221VWS9_9PSEU|nr:methyltransferase domain-containing protein [Actinoalloteichus hoggarensis]ASO18006.1 ubiquinone/menaquinone biosynthesis methyltransferase [Actinoalloteichus hoggarensis]MBB5924418.1 ubiquinone/menaquinone biosynthesis C-methylase UbiE [Actinoalloteichus hoggarensis]
MTNPAAIFDDLAPDYDENGYHRALAETLVAALPRSGRPATVLDVATGTGVAAFAALRHLKPARVTAVDIAGSMIARARESAAVDDPTGVISWHVGPGVPAPVAGQSVDVVLCASSLHFLGSAALGDWLRVLRPGGRAAFTLPAAGHFRPSGVFAELVSPDLPIPADERQAAEVAVTAGFTEVVARRHETGGDHPKAVFLVHAVAPVQGASEAP